MGHRNFDTERAKRPPDDFTIAGEKFTVRQRVRPEVIAGWQDYTLGMQEGASPTSSRSLAEADVTIRAMLVEKDQPRWDKLRQRDDEGAVSIDELFSVLAYLIDLQMKAVSGDDQKAAD